MTKTTCEIPGKGRNRGSEKTQVGPVEHIKPNNSCGVVDCGGFPAMVPEGPEVLGRGFRDMRVVVDTPIYRCASTASGVGGVVGAGTVLRAKILKHAVYAGGWALVTLGVAHGYVRVDALEWVR